MNSPRSRASLIGMAAGVTLWMLALATSPAAAQSAEVMPWDQPLDTLAALLSGPIAHAFVALALTVGFLVYGLQGNCKPARRLFRAGITTAVAIEAVKLLNYLLPY